MNFGFGHKLYSWKGHDPIDKLLNPPVTDTWYPVISSIKNIRLLWVEVEQSNTETDAKDIQMRWVLDSVTYYQAQSALNGATYYIFKSQYPSTGGADGIAFSAARFNAGYYIDKRAHEASIYIRNHSAAGTAQTLRCFVCYETLETTTP